LPKTILLTGLTLIAFAANSLLCRAALAPGSGETGLIDPIAFTTLRLTSGALFLAALIAVQHGSLAPFKTPSWRPAIALAGYAIAFSLAYVSLGAGIGALLLFASVQITMIGHGLLKGTRPSTLEWLGITAALAGLVYLLLPGLSAPPLGGAALMIVSGIGWGFYTLYGKGQKDPALATARNFIYCLPFALAFALLPGAFAHVTLGGVILAFSSGMLASGIGYIIWYSALRGLTNTIAAIVQLAVPLVAALGGVLFLSETLTLRFAFASALILGGILITILGSQKTSS
jgi:drug/metabolite transporter (DMT)-like permease